MNLSFNMKLENVDKADDIIQNKSKKILWQAMNKMEELAKMRCPVDTGRLRSSITLYPAFQGLTEYYLVDGVDYGIHVEYGTSPHDMPINPLYGWSRRVLGDESLAYAVRNKIAKFGTPAQPFFRPALHEVKTIYLPRISDGILGGA